MTVQTVGWVLDHSQAKGFARLVLISLANHANRLGASCHPSLETIAREAGVGRASVVRAIEALEASGEIIVRRGSGRGNRNEYVLVMGREKRSLADLFINPDGGEKSIGADRKKRSGADPLPGPCDGEKVQKRSAPLRARVDIRPSDSISHRTTTTASSTTSVPSSANGSATDRSDHPADLLLAMSYETLIGRDAWRQITADFSRLSPNLSPTWLRTTLAHAPPALDREVVLTGLDRAYQRLEETARTANVGPVEQRIRNWGSYGRSQVLAAVSEVMNGE